ncbi:MAG: YidC/Oxa1 family membrane protein insertase [Oscillospiraceae bacterium]|nr:YidC/Oxa1 family membrane protein insertase [Oscillospiraceae bacterium]
MGFLSELIGYPLGWIMYVVYLVVNNYGVAIALFTVITKLILLPLSIKTQKSTAAMTAFNPKLEQLKKQYANNPNKLQEEQMKLYSEEGINPMASCLPMIIQLIFLYGVFDVVYRPITHILRIDEDVIDKASAIMLGIEEYASNSYAKSRPELYIIKAIEKYPDLFSDMSDFVDTVSGFNNKLFGVIDLGEIPRIVLSSDTVWNEASVGLLIIPILSGVIQFAMTFMTMSRQKKNNSGASQSMAGMNMMFYIMPIFSIYIAFSYPAGIGFYWIMSSLTSWIINEILHRIYTPEYMAKIAEKEKTKKKKKKKSAFMEKYNEMLKEQLETQNAQNGGKISSSSKKKDDFYDDDFDADNLSKSKAKEYERRIIAEARRRQEKKYTSEEQSAEISAEDSAIEEARRRIAKKYGDD